jgi:hypothetical protein
MYKMTCDSKINLYIYKWTQYIIELQKFSCFFMQFLKKQRYIDDELGGLKNIFFATHTHSYI